MGSHVGSSTTDPSATVDADTEPELDYLPEVENFDVQLKKDSQGLGITIAGYVCERGIYLSFLLKLTGRIFYVHFIYRGIIGHFCEKYQSRKRG